MHIRCITYVYFVSEQWFYFSVKTDFSRTYIRVAAATDSWFIAEAALMRSHDDSHAHESRQPITLHRLSTFIIRITMAMAQNNKMATGNRLQCDLCIATLCEVPVVLDAKHNLYIGPRYLYNAPSLTTFRRELRTVLFRSSFDND